MANTRIKAPTGARSRTLGDVLRALLAGVLLAAILAGIPYGLVRLVGWPLPRTMPDMSMLTQAVGVDTMIDILSVIVWILWAQFAFCVAVELRAAVSGIDIDIRLPATGTSQALARKLVTTMLLVGAGALTVSQAASAAPIPAQARVAAVAAAVPSAAPQASAASAAATTTASGPVYTVQASTSSHHETLWDIAERHLGNGKRYKEIFELNKNRVQPDGGRMTEAGLVRAGWTLVMPADATGLPGAVVDGSRHTVTVQEGDTLSKIAEEELGSADAYPRLLDASKDVVQPGGRHLANPDELFPGDIIVIPAPAAATPAPPATTPAPAPASTPTPQPAPADAAPKPSSPAAAPPSTPSPAPSQSAPTTAPAATAPAPAAPSAPAAAAPQAPEATEPASSDSSQSPISVQQGVGGIAALLGAGALAVLAARRRAQQRERRPGEQIAMPQETSQAEMVLDRTASPVLVDLLDRALRTLAHQHPQHLPQIIGARVQQDRVEILVEDSDAEALAPFTDRPGGWWGLRGDRAVLLSADDARAVPAPYPGLATVGTAEDGTLLLADLHHARVLLLDGDEQNVREVARGIAMEAGTALWADHIEITTAGFGLELQQLLPQCRTMFAPRLATATADLARVIVEVHQAVHEGGEEPQPWMVVCSTVPSPEELYEFADVMGKVPTGVRVAAVLPAAGRATELFPDAEVLDANQVTELQSLESLDAQVVLQRVTDEVYRQLTAGMTIAAQPATPAEGAWAEVPDPDRKVFGPSTVQKGAAARSHLSLLAAPTKAQPVDADKLEETELEMQEKSVPAAAGTVQDPVGPAPSKATEPTATEAVEDALPAQAAAAAGAGCGASDEAPDAPAAARLPKASPRVSVVREGDAPAPADGSAPQVQVLGPLRITGIGDAPIQPKLVLLAALLLFKSDRSYGAIANNMDPVSPWTQSTMDTHMSRLRRRLGTDAAGEPYLRPKPKGVEQYTLSHEVTCDYAAFNYLATRGLPHGATGVLDLEASLGLVRGRPFGGAGAHTWAAPLVQTFVGQIVDVAHAVATLRIQDEVLDIDAARRAVTVGLDVEPAAELLYRSWMRIEHRAGNPAGVREVIDQVRQMTVDMGWDGMLQDETEQLIARLTAKPAARMR
ncbi:LysM peptidoglycan-binding domain-containing protein [Kitasatospora sp. NPDC058965]|uniref:LysM peptidoglycan-binding domain-containing protein n=1 Tax=Kitasatospora sp. NPDC058965 TaxID=3346682 RepID=UPI00369D0982